MDGLLVFGASPSRYHISLVYNHIKKMHYCDMMGYVIRRSKGGSIKVVPSCHQQTEKDTN